MNCKEFWLTYAKSGLTGDCRNHIKECAECEKEFALECELDKVLDDLTVYTAPETVWDAVASSIAETTQVLPEKKSLLDRLKRFISGMVSDTLTFRPAVIGFVAVIILIAVGTFYSKQVLFPISEDVIQERTVRKLKEKDREYLAAIERFSKHHEASAVDIDPELYDLYKEKLAILDEFIAQCAEAVNENEYNINANRYLALAYKEKVETLMEMTGHM